MSSAQPAKPTLPPGAVMAEMIFGFMTSQAIYVAAELGIADLLKEKPKSSALLAAETGVDARSLFRVMRALCSVGIFAETDPDSFGLTPLAETLRSDSPDSLRGTAIFMGAEFHLRPWAHIMYSVRTGKPASDEVFGAPIFDWFGQNPAEAKIFHEAMSSLSGSIVGAIIAGYDFSGIERIVDVAGGQGQLISAILKANPQMKGILFDVPVVIEKARQLLAAAGLADRCELATGNFFEAVPGGGDAYIMKHIIHDWDDERALQILRNCHRVMRVGDKVLLVEMVIPQGNEPNPGKFLDLEMLLYTGGCERTQEEYRDLLDRAGFKLTKITPTESPYSVIEAVRS